VRPIAPPPTPPPTPLDPSFWWAFSTANPQTPPFTFTTEEDGIHFKGKKTYDGASMISLTFGATARFELHANRIPPSPIGVWRSDPHVFLKGKFTGYVGSGDLLSGDRWSRCWMVKRQTLFQFVFAPPGVDNRHQIVEEKASQVIFDIQDSLTGDGDVQSHLMEGMNSIPSVTFDASKVFPGISIFAEIEVRFDLQLEGDSLFWIDDELILQYDQWPLTALA
ncbi:hypothetical protein, partial [Streptomyces sp. CS081A]|uniref:hypothetical protein n=2 Tax=Streptomyces TaxID=1883 RepID=UPI0013A59733